MSSNYNDYASYARVLNFSPGAGNFSILSGGQDGDPYFHMNNFQSAGPTPQTWLRRAIPGGPFTTLIFSGRFRVNTSGALASISAYDLINGVSHATITFNGLTGVISVSNSIGTLLTTGPAQFPINAFFWLEISFTIGSGTSGAITVRVQTIPKVTLSGINTQNGSRAFCDTTVFSVNQNGSFDMQHLIWSDTTGAYNNSFLGDRRVFAGIPNAAGSTTQFTPVGNASNYQNAGLVPPGGDTDYNVSGTVGNIDLYKGTYPANVTGVAGILVSAISRKDDSGTRSLATLLQSGGSTSTGASVPMADSYTVQTDTFETDPSTSVPFTAAALPNVQFGAKVSA